MRQPWLVALLVCSFFAGLFASVVLAQAPTPERQDVENAGTAAPGVQVSQGSDKPTSQPIPSEKIAALRQAAANLVKAGLLDEAARLKQRAAELEKDSGRALLAEELKQLDALQAEVDVLRKLTGRGSQILLKVQAIEVSRTKSRELSVMDFDDFLRPREQSQFHIAATCDPARLQATIQDWKRLKVAKVLAEPTLVTLSGRLAVFNTGGEFPVRLTSDPAPEKVEYKQFGTRVEMLPTAVGSDRVRIDMKLRLGELIQSDSVAADQVLPPSLKVSQFDTSYECAWNEAIVLRGLVRQQPDRPKTPDGEPAQAAEEAELVVIVTPEAVDVLDQQVGN